MLRPPGSLAHRVAVCVSARNGVRLVEQAVTDLAREMRAQAVEVGLEAVELLRPVSRAHLRRNVPVQRGPDLFCPAGPRSLVGLLEHLLLEAVSARGPGRRGIVDEL
jgi:hypothetical protein